MKKILRKNITLSSRHMKILEPIIQKHDGNVSAAMREIIDFLGFAMSTFGSIDNAEKALLETDESGGEYIDMIYGVKIPLSFFKWLLTERADVLPPFDESAQFFFPRLAAADLNSLLQDLNNKNKILNWPVFVKSTGHDKDIIVLISGTDPLINWFEAMLIAVYLANSPEPYELTSLLKLPYSLQMQFREGRKEQAIAALNRHFGMSKEPAGQ
ncbi:MAG TPA: hypothetical protein HA257_08150 [Candidatus Methanoperedenaceae archaeon]|nr:hypothetical protein [Candidatus Methanoperedenaceae archaeon]